MLFAETWAFIKNKTKKTNFIRPTQSVALDSQGSEITI